MSAGTLRLTNNSLAVAGTGTAFTTDLKPGDFIVATVGGVLYTLPVDAVTSNTAATLASVFTGPTTTGAAWAAVPRKTMNQLTAELVAQSTQAIRGLNADKANWQQFYTGPEDITVVLPDGSQVTGVSWPKITRVIENADLDGHKAVGEQIRADAQQVSKDKAAAKGSADAAAASATTAGQKATDAADSARQAADSAAASASSATAAAGSVEVGSQKANEAGQSAVRAKASADEAASLVGGVSHETTPFPDVWLPLTDSMLMLAGAGPFDRITLGSQYVELPTRSASFSRATTATYIDKCGELQTAEINEPRFETEGLLLEGQGTNLASYSTALDNSYWPKARANTVSGFTAPDGTVTAVKLIPTTEAGSHYISKPMTVAAGSAYAWSLFVKAGEFTQCRLNFSGAASTNNMSCDFDLVTGTATPVTGAGKPSIVALADGWFRISAITEVFTTSGAANFNLWVMDAGNINPTGDGVKGIYVWGAQSEEGSFPTSFIKTETTAATRAADSWSVSSLNAAYKTLTQKFSRTVSFNLVIKYQPTTYYNDVVIVKGVTHDIICRMHNTGKLYCYRSAAGLTVDVANNDSGVYAQRTDGDISAMFFAGKTVSAVRVPVSTDAVPYKIGSDSSTSVKFVYHIKNVRIWHSALTDNQIKGLR